MINVKVFKKNEKDIIKIVVKGHSFYSEKGKDIVCSAVSAIINGLANFLVDSNKMFDKIKIFYFDSYVSFIVKKEIMKDKKGENKYFFLLNFVIFQLKNIERSYRENIKVSEINLWEKKKKKFC